MLIMPLKGIAKITVMVGNLPPAKVVSFLDKYKEMYKEVTDALQAQGFGVVYLPSRTRDTDLELLFI